jgi:hypothetical protein
MFERGKINTFYTFIHSNANLLGFFFLVSEKGVIIICILDSMLKCSRKKSKIHVLGTDTDPDRLELDRQTLDPIAIRIR